MLKTICKISTRAFTLVEMIIVIALLALIMAVAMPFGLNFLQQQRVEEETLSLADSLKMAQARAIAGKNDSAWGIKFDEPKVGQYTLFSGSSYEVRSSSYDEVFELSSGTNVSSTASEIVFEKITGEPIIQ